MISYTPAQRAAAVADYLAGASTSEVSRTHGPSARTIRRWVTESGHTVRPWAPPPSETKPCSVDDCDVDARARGWCGKHWQRWRNTGDPLGVNDGSAERRPRRDAVRHGTRRCYDTGCRCLPCAIANSRYLAELAAGDRRRVPAGEVTKHIADLLKDGWTRASIGREAGLGRTTVWHITSGRVASVNSRTAASILELPVGRAIQLDPSPLTDAIGRYRSSGGIVSRTDQRHLSRAMSEGTISELAADRIACSYGVGPLILLYGQVAA